MEDPGYPPARQLFHSLGARVVSVPIDDEGLVVSAIPRAAQLIYVTPSHQFPLGAPMSLQRRTALLEWAERRRAVVIEDDYDSEFRFEGRPLDPLQRLDRTGRVIYVGSFSKVMLPTLRLGFLIAPRSGSATGMENSPRRPRLRASSIKGCWHDTFAKWRGNTRRVTPTFVEAIQVGFDGRLRAVPSVAGLHVAAEVASGVSLDLEQVVRRAETWGVVVRTLADFSVHSSRTGLVIGYGMIPTDKIQEGMRRLARCVRLNRRAPGGPK